jgi:hypothetical protein
MLKLSSLSHLEPPLTTGIFTIGLVVFCLQFENARDAEDAIRGRDGYNFDGSRLRVLTGSNCFSIYLLLLASFISHCYYAG